MTGLDAWALLLGAKKGLPSYIPTLCLRVRIL